MAAPTALLGLCDAELDSKRHRSSCLTNKLGGAPDWPPHASRTPPRCGRCGAPLAHVVQVYCPLQGSPYHRNLHLFACTSAACSGRSDTWTALRSQSLEERTPSRPDPPQEAPLAATDWCDTADDWGVEEEEEEEEEAGGDKYKYSSGEFDVSSQLQDLRLLDSQDDVPVLREFFISVVEESDLCGEEDDLHHARKLLKEYERREGVAVGELEDGDGGGDGGKEKYEKTRARHGDAVFSRFMKKISLCPQQILRYSHGGKPLFISEPPADLDRLVTACGSCGGTRTFELQLMPALVSLLRGKDGGGVEAELEFGTVLVYTCRDSCWTAGSGSGSGSPVEEFCFVQTDPDQQLFK